MGLCLIGVIWAGDQIGILTDASPVNYSLAEIQKITFVGANTVIHFVGGSSSSFASVGSKWLFGSVSSSSGNVAVNSPFDNAFRYQIQSNLLSVSADQSSQFRLLRMNGQVYAESKPMQREWSVSLCAESLILQVQNTNSVKNYHIQVQK